MKLFCVHFYFVQYTSLNENLEAFKSYEDSSKVHSSYFVAHISIYIFYYYQNNGNTTPN